MKKSSKFIEIPIYYGYKNYTLSENPNNIQFKFGSSRDINSKLGKLEYLSEEVRLNLAVLFRTYYVTKKTKRAKVDLNNYLYAYIYKYKNGYYFELRCKIKSSVFEPFMLQPRLYSDIKDLTYDLVTNFEWREACTKFMSK